MVCDYQKGGAKSRNSNDLSALSSVFFRLGREKMKKSILFLRSLSLNVYFYD